MTAGIVEALSVLDVMEEEDMLLDVVVEEREEAERPQEPRPRGHMLDSN